jgi:glycosyltransferase involved in cell wall biosynthesis
MHAPLVSVLLPVYNAEPYIGLALDSILRQEYERLEVIAIDDGSNDRSLNILRQYQQADKRVSIVSRENRGLVTSLNEGLALARGDLIARMDADDIAYPWRLSRQVAMFNQQPECAICGSGFDTLVGNRLVRGRPNPIFERCSLRILSRFFTIFIHSTVVYNRRIIPEDMLRYDPSYVHAEDFDLFKRIADRFPATMIGNSLIAYRIHDDSVSSRYKREMQRTHLRIVAEGLKQDALVDQPGILLDIGESVTLDTVRSAAACVLALEEKVATLPAEKRPSYEEGVLNLFYFLYLLIGDEQRPELTHEFLTRAGKWGSIRRREQYGLLAAAHAPWLSLLSIAATKRVDALSRYLQSVPAAAVLPV